MKQLLVDDDLVGHVDEETTAWRQGCAWVEKVVNLVEVLKLNQTEDKERAI